MEYAAITSNIQHHDDITQSVKKKRILWLVSAYPESPLFSLPYITRELASLCRYLGNHEAGLDLYVLCQSDVGTSREYGINRPIYEYEKSMGEERLFALPPDSLSGFRRRSSRILELVRDKDISLVHTEHLMGGVNLADIANLGIPVVNSYRASEIVWRDDDTLRRGSRVLEPGYEEFLTNLLPQLTMHLPVSGFVASFLQGFGLQSDRIQVVHNGVDLSEFSLDLAQRDDGCIRALAYKTTNALWQAVYRTLQDNPGIQFQFIDAPADRHAEYAWLSKPEIQSRVSIRGRVDAEEIPSLFAGSDLVLHMTDWDGCSNFVLEGMASGRPVIGIRDFGVDELVVHNKTGLLLSGDTSQEIVDAITLLARDRKLRRRMGRCGRARVETSFTAERKAADYVEVYRSILS